MPFQSGIVLGPRDIARGGALVEDFVGGNAAAGEERSDNDGDPEMDVMIVGGAHADVLPGLLDAGNIAVGVGFDRVGVGVGDLE